LLDGTPKRATGQVEAKPHLEQVTLGAIPAKGSDKMVIERRWKKWVYFYIPLTLFLIGTLFPFYWMFITSIRPDAELYRS
jgi:hypothetical protein